MSKVHFSDILFQCSVLRGPTAKPHMSYWLVLKRVDTQRWDLRAYPMTSSRKTCNMYQNQTSTTEADRPTPHMPPFPSYITIDFLYLELLLFSYPIQGAWYPGPQGSQGWDTDWKHSIVTNRQQLLGGGFKIDPWKTNSTFAPENRPLERRFLLVSGKVFFYPTWGDDPIWLLFLWIGLKPPPGPVFFQSFVGGIILPLLAGSIICPIVGILLTNQHFMHFFCRSSLWQSPLKFTVPLKSSKGHPNNWYALLISSWKVLGRVLNDDSLSFDASNFSTESQQQMYRITTWTTTCAMKFWLSTLNFLKIVWNKC